MITQGGDQRLGSRASYAVTVCSAQYQVSAHRSDASSTCSRKRYLNFAGKQCSHAVAGNCAFSTVDDTSTAVRESWKHLVGAKSVADRTRNLQRYAHAHAIMSSKDRRDYYIMLVTGRGTKGSIRPKKQRGRGALDEGGVSEHSTVVSHTHTSFLVRQKPDLRVHMCDIFLDVCVPTTSDGVPQGGCNLNSCSPLLAS